MKFLMVFFASFIFAGFAFADDPGERDSLIVETVFAELGDSTVDVMIYVTCDEEIAFYNFPLAWSPNGGNGIYPVDVTDYNIISQWFEHFDSVLYDEGFIRMIGWIDNSEPPLITYNLRLHCWTAHFAIDSLASPQIVSIDTTYDFVNGPLFFGLVGGVDLLTPEFIPGAIYYGTTPVNSDESRFQPSEFSLRQNFPNPFNASTTIKFTLPQEADVKLAIYNILGQKVATLFDGRKPAGYHAITWDAGDAPSGVYFARLKVEDYSKSIKMVLLK